MLVRVAVWCIVLLFVVVMCCCVVVVMLFVSVDVRRLLLLSFVCVVVSGCDYSTFGVCV